ncbi:MAG: tetratricopeptide repeat protein [Bryobacteraceae bacterium]
MRKRIIFCCLAGLIAATAGELESARDRQDRAALEKLANDVGAAAAKSPDDANAQYRAALAFSYLAEVTQELRDKGAAKRAAESGIRHAERAIALKPSNGEYHRILGTLCGQVIPANVLAGLSYGKQAQTEVGKAIELDPKSPRAYVSRGVGNYYLPEAFGGGAANAIRDFQKAIGLDPKSGEAHLWLGLALRKSNRNGEARKAFEKSLQLNPNRVWTKQQLDKTPTQ